MLLLSSQITRRLAFIGVLSVTNQGQAGTIDGDLNISFESVGVEAALLDGIEADIPAGAIVINPDSDLSFGYRIRLKLDNNAMFKDADYVLEQSTAGATTGITTHFDLVTFPASGSSELEFRVTNAAGINSNHEYILSGSSVVNAPVNFQLPGLQAGNTINMSGEILEFSDFRESLGQVKLFEYFEEFTGAVGTLADATIQRLSKRTTFLNDEVLDLITLNLNDLGVDNGSVLGKRDVVDITLSANLSGITEIELNTDGISRGTFTLDTAAQTATFRATASDVLAATNSSLIIKVSGSDRLTTRNFMVQADLSLLNSLDKSLVKANTLAGKWSYDGFEAKVPVSMNVTESFSNFMFTNESFFAAEVDAEILWTENGEIQALMNTEFGEVPARGLLTVTESDILQALGNPEGLVEALITFNVTGQTNLIQLSAEKTFDDGMLSLPVFFNIGSESFRNWTR